MEDSEVIRRVLETGEVSLGTRALSRAKRKPALVILSSNAPEAAKRAAEKASAPVYRFAGGSLDLGEICGKPFPVAALAVVSAGQADISQLLKVASK
jgi:large subunit ribosomal protein L30e